MCIRDNRGTKERGLYVLTPKEKKSVRILAHENI